MLLDINKLLHRRTAGLLLGFTPSQRLILIQPQRIYSLTYHDKLDLVHVSSLQLLNGCFLKSIEETNVDHTIKRLYQWIIFRHRGDNREKEHAAPWAILQIRGLDSIGVLWCPCILRRSRRKWDMVDMLFLWEIALMNLVCLFDRISVFEPNHSSSKIWWAPWHEYYRTRWSLQGYFLFGVTADYWTIYKVRCLLSLFNRVDNNLEAGPSRRERNRMHDLQWPYAGGLRPSLLPIFADQLRHWAQWWRGRQLTIQWGIPYWMRDMCCENCR